MLTAREAQSLTIENLKERIPPNTIKIIAAKIQHVISNGGVEVIVSKDELVHNGKPISSKDMRYTEVLLKSKGYGVEMGYACMNMTVRWM